MTYRIFLSSPSDVEPERQAFRRAIDRINERVAAESQLEAVLWEEKFYRADRSFQDQISPSAGCDVVVCVLWNKIGVALPEHYARADGTLPTGTEFEFETALARALNTDPRVPDIFMFRKEADLNLRQDELLQSADQYNLLEQFWRKWFHNEQGQFVAAFNTFGSVAEFEKKIENALQEWLDERSVAKVWTEGSPYRGLARFEPDHAKIFFGRKREIDVARARLCTNASKGHRALFVVGASGSGKSSLVGAGLIPALERSGGTVGLPILARRVMTKPSELLRGSQWANGLARLIYDDAVLGAELAGGDCHDWESLAEIMVGGGPGAAFTLSAALKRLSDARGAAQGLILFVDQFEELLAWPKEEAEAFCALLHSLSTRSDIFVLATIRSEFQYLLAAFPAFQTLAEANGLASHATPLPRLDLRPPTRGGLEAIIREPAELAGLIFEEGLVERLEAVAVPEALPALQFLLDQLYAMRNGSVMTHHAFDALGGIDGVMARRGDDALAALGAKATKAFRPFARLLLAASGTQDTVLARMVPHELVAKDADMLALAQGLRDAGLLISDEGGYRLAHEALIEGWPALREVVEEERRNFSQLSYLSAMAKRYTDAGGATSRAAGQLLLKKLPLREARALQREWGDAALAAGHPDLPGFIRRSVRAVWQRGVLGAGVAAALAAAVGSVGFWLQGVNRDALLQDGYAALAAGDHRMSLDIAAQLLGRQESSDSLSFATAVLLNMDNGRHDGTLPDAVSALSPRRTAAGIVTLSPDGRLSLLPEEEQVQVAGLEGASINAITHLPDDTVMVLTSATRIGRLSLPTDLAAIDAIMPNWLDVSEAPLVRRSQWDFHVGPEDARLVLADGDPEAGLTVTCVYQAACFDSRDLPNSVDTVAFDPGGARVYWSAPGPSVGLSSLSAENAGGWDSLAGETAEAVTALAPLLDGRVLAGMGSGGLMRYDPAERDLATIFQRPAHVAVSPMPVVDDPNSMQVAFRCGAQVICAGPDEAPFRLFFPAQAGLKDIVWSLDGSQFWTVSYGNQADVWRTQSGNDFGLPLSFGAEIMAIDVSADGALLGVGLRSGAALILDQTGAVVSQTAPGSESVTRVRFAPDGSLGIASDGGAIAVLRPDGAVANCHLGIPIDDLLWVRQSEEAQVIGLTVQGYVLASASGDGDLACDYRSLLPARDARGIGGGAPLGGSEFVATRSDGALLRIDAAISDLEGSTDTVVPLELSADDAASRSVDISRSGRWLAVARTEPQLRLFDLSVPQLDHHRIGLPGANTQTVTFSPDGQFVAVLGADGWLAVFGFTDGVLEPILQLDAPVPDPLRHGGAARDATWIDWLSEDELAVGTVSGDILSLSVDASTITQNLERLQARYRAVAP